MNSFQDRMTAVKMPHFAVWLCAAIVITVVSFLTSYFPIWANIPVNVILPFLVLIYLKTVFFEKLKLSTLTAYRNSCCSIYRLFCKHRRLMVCVRCAGIFNHQYP